MELPIELKNIIDNELDKINIKELKKDAENISLRYRNESGKGKRLVTESAEALAYAAVRMPATYGSVYTCLKNTLEIYNDEIKSVLDVGAGTGAGSWAVWSLIDVDKITCLEREDAMRNLGKLFMQESGISVLENARWEKFDLLNSNIEQKADLVICSYVLNELNESDREMALKKLWNATNKILLIIEPGTPIGFREIKTFREDLIDMGAMILAPCPNIEKCPMPENDWCHATCRVSRTKIHKLLKNGDVPYEDEKFSYIAVSRIIDDEKNINESDKNNLMNRNSIISKMNNRARVLRHPLVESGKITLKLCTSEGICDKIVTKKDKELFKVARKLNCGDLI